MSETNGDFTVSLIRDAIDTVPVPAKLSDVIQGIAEGRWAGPVSIVRAAFEAGGREAADAPKKRLPGILFSGTFSKRANNALLHHSGLITVDLDKLGAQAEAWKEKLVSDPHVLCAFISPTGSGVKAVFRCDPERDHYDSFKAAEHYVKEHFGLQIDAACKDVARICFVSHDPEAVLAHDAEVLPYPEPPEPEEFHSPSTGTGHQPGDDYDKLDEWKTVLKDKGWKEEKTDHWTRPGKTSGTSATWNKCKIPNRFWVFSSDAPPFQHNKTYRPWHIYTLLEHAGEWPDAARALGLRGMGKPPKKPGERLLSEPDPEPVITAARSLFDFPLVKDGDESILLGDRYLNRGDGCVISSTSGMGKSALAIQMATELALNKGPFGIQGNGPLKSLIVQSEDSDGDIAEIAHSMRHVLKLTDEEVALVNQRVKIVTDRVNRGARFIASLRKQIADFTPDLVWPNPLQAFMDGDVTVGKDLGKFLREGLNSLNQPPAFGYMLIHHTTKPATGKDRSERLWHEVMYDMAGGAEIINWARAIISLRATETEGEFNLVLAKRGRRAGVTKQVPQGVGFVLEPLTTIPLKHATGRIEVEGIKRGIPLIYWEPRTTPDQPKGKSSGRPEKYPFSSFRSVFPKKTDPGQPFNQILRAVASNAGGIPRGSLQGVLNRWSEHGDIVIIMPESGPMTYRAAL